MLVCKGPNSNWLSKWSRKNKTGLPKPHYWPLEQAESSRSPMTLLLSGVMLGLHFSGLSFYAVHRARNQNSKGNQPSGNFYSVVNIESSLLSAFSAHIFQVRTMRFQMLDKVPKDASTGTGSLLSAYTSFTPLGNRSLDTIRWGLSTSWPRVELEI
jgi:hypothetical protein